MIMTLTILARLNRYNYHIVLYLGSTVKDTSDVARWFGIADNFVRRT